MSKESKRRYGIFTESNTYGDIVAIFIIMLLIGGMFGVYRINTGEGAILTTVNGVKIPIKEVGWHWRAPLFTDLVKDRVVNKNIYFPSDYLDLEQKFQGDQQAGAIGFDIKTTDDKVVDTGAVMSFSITDLFQYGVMNAYPQEQLQKAFDATVFNYLQDQSSDKITSHISEVNVEMLVAMKLSNMEEQFGITINDVSLLRPTFTKIALEKLAEKQGIQAVAEGKLNAARSEAEAIETIANAMKAQSNILANIPQNQLDFNARMALYSNLKGQPNVVWVIDTNREVPIVLQK